MGAHSKRAHALWNASSADFWMECGQWAHHKIAAEEAGRDYDRRSEAADRGTLCHEVAERVLDMALDEEEEIGSIAALKGSQALLTKEEIGLVATAVEAVVELINAHVGTDEEFEVATEVALRLSHEPESEGHVDVLAWTRRLVIVADYKFGEGAVSIVDNHQLRIYGANALDWLLAEGHDVDDDAVVVLAVVQPRLHQEALVRKYHASDLYAYQHHVEHVVEAQRTRGDTRGASSLATCDWCPFKEQCDHHRNLKRNMFGKLKKLGPAKDADTEFVEEVVRARSAIKKLVDEMVAIVVEDPDRFPNWTRAQVANARKWSPLVGDESIGAQLIAAGATEVYGLRSPAQVRDANKKLGKLVEQLSIDQGHHVRLYEGAPKSAVIVEPPKRPANKPVRKKSKSK